MLRFAFVLGVVFVSVCCKIALADPPATLRETTGPATRPTDWGLNSGIQSHGMVFWNRQGLLSKFSDEISLQIGFDKPPFAVVARDEKSQSYLRLPFAVERRKTAGKLVFTSPDDKKADFGIPFCTVTTQQFDSPKLSLSISKFRDYPGDLKFNIQLETTAGNRVRIDDMDFFSDGSEHHVYGHVKLFGVTITNTEKEPLVLRLSGDRYEYVSGKGTAVTADGQTLKFGK
jgi:hypothetical protein